MKTIKSKYRVLTYLICFSFLAVTQISCENNDDLEEIIEKSKLEISAKKDKETHKMAESNKAFAHFGRRRSKPKKRIYVVTVATNNESIDEVRSVIVEIENKKGFFNENKKYILELSKDRKETKEFTSEDITIENDDIIGQEVNVKMYFLDANQRTIGEPLSQTVIVSNTKAPRISFRRAMKTTIASRINNSYRSTVILKDKDNEVSSISLEIEQKEGFIKETKTYYLAYFTTLKGEKYYTFGDIKFENREIENQEVTVNITLLDAKKEVISKTTEVVVVAGLVNTSIKEGSSTIKQNKDGVCVFSANLEKSEEELNEIEILIEKLPKGEKIVNFKLTTPKNDRINSSFNYNGKSESLYITYTLKDMFGDVIYIKPRHLVRKQLRERAVYKKRMRSAEY
ncbi:uS7 family ribosomal protein [Polaribacter glomeratus]|uniref:Uncharacterized protein n=1 Tax=Polaribacter glomeratus TaxID=102 RepID=A0A2S7WJI9_9FLAO|nr:hypothetical protein [Polaribacter glomeratus]PQJ77462.1 hypothetical protein BTO16_16695 [Polaribacter glomeratus]TXD66050.1 hypothetical protein ESX12_07790 [Polaribacter glomeratus]